MTVAGMGVSERAQGNGSQGKEKAAPKRCGRFHARGYAGKAAGTIPVNAVLTGKIGTATATRGKRRSGRSTIISSCSTTELPLQA